jgi:protein N-terminal glutamine amidohydrolase
MTSYHDGDLESSLSEESKHRYHYHPCFCEENVYMLAESLVEKKKDSYLTTLYVVFITSLSKATPIWEQKASSAADRPVLWDYHVVLLAFDNHPSPAQKRCYVYDYDSRLNFPCDAHEYNQRSFGSLDMSLRQEHAQ